MAEHDPMTAVAAALHDPALHDHRPADRGQPSGEPAGERMTPMEIEARREALGVSIGWIADELGVHERTW